MPLSAFFEAFFLFALLLGAMGLVSDETQPVKQHSQGGALG